jgi:GABA(A) receptor-associated protein
MTSFKEKYDFEKRKMEVDRIRDKYPTKIPIIVEKNKKSSVPDLDKGKFLVPADLTVGQFLHIVRKRIKLSSEQALYIFINNTIPPTSAPLTSLYEHHKDEDGFLYITYSGENTFGTL